MGSLISLRRKATRMAESLKTMMKAANSSSFRSHCRPHQQRLEKVYFEAEECTFPILRDLATFVFSFRFRYRLGCSRPLRWRERRTERSGRGETILGSNRCIVSDELLKLTAIIQLGTQVMQRATTAVRCLFDLPDGSQVRRCLMKLFMKEGSEI